MDTAYIIGVDVNAGIGTTHWDPPFSDVFRARLATGHISEDELKSLDEKQSLILSKLVRFRVPEVIGMSTGPFVLAPALRDFIEQIEPGVHRFFPVQIRTAKAIDGKQDYGTHWLLYPPPRIDCLDFERTVFMSDIQGKQWPRRRYDGNPWGEVSLDIGTRMSILPQPVTFMRPLVENRHLWRTAKGSDLGYTYYTCSPTFWKFYTEKRMIGWEVYAYCRI